MASLSPQERRAAILAIEILAEAIETAGPAGLPSGRLYAACMGHMSLASYSAIIDALKAAGKVREDGSHLLHWCGPRRPGLPQGRG